MRQNLTIILFLFTSSVFAQNTVPGEILIQFDPADDPYSFVRQYNAEETTDIISIDCLNEIASIYRLEFADKNISLDNALITLQGYQSVLLAQKNHLVQERETIPTDDLFESQWHLKNTGEDGGEIDADIDATDAWDTTTGGLTTHGDTIVVCVIEGGGVDITHFELAPNIWHNYNEIPDDGIDNDNNGYVDDFNGWDVQSETDGVGFGTHGTRVSGMIGAKGNNDVGLSGVNWDVKMMIVKGQIASNEATVIAAYSYPLKMRQLYNETYGEKGAFVVATNASWGIDGGVPEDSPLWCAMYDTLGAYGILNVGATTNNNLNVEESGDLPTNCSSEFLVGVTMTNNEDQRASSGYGITSVDLGAPGSGVRVTTPGDAFSSATGTSYAAPVVTGAIALAYSAPCAEFINLAKYDPSAAALQMRDFLLNGVDPIPSLASEVVTGGRLNVNNTINLMMDGCDPDACIPPYNVQVASYSDTSILLNWDGFSSFYEVLISEAGSEPVAHEVDGSFSILFDTLKPCTDYRFTVVAFCDPEWSEPSFELNFRTDGCCTNPPLILDNKTTDALTLNWNEVLYATSYDLRYAPTGTEDWTTIEDVSEPMVTIDGLTGCTEYDIQIYTLCGDSTQGFSESYTFRTNGCGACVEADYCPVNGANSNFEWIDTVKINGALSGTGDDSGWLISPTIITALTPGETHLLTVKPGFLGSSFTERYSVYIDFNQNGEFDLPEERLVDDVSFLGTLNQTLFIPEDAEIGVTKIRIGMAGLSEPIPCPNSSFYGEYEDCCVYIGPQASIEENDLNLALYPNPTNGVVQIQTTLEVRAFSVYNASGQQVYYESGIFDSSALEINLSSFAPGLYYLQVATESGVITKKVIKQ